MSLSRRGSTSSVETIVQELVERRIDGIKRSKPCPQCKKLISDALVNPIPVAPSGENFDREMSDEPSLLVSKKKLYSRSFTGVQDLQDSAKTCPMCRLLWQILRGADDTLLDQVLKYSNDEFNATNLYLPDGGTDIEELLNPGPKVKISASATLEYPKPLQSPPLQIERRHELASTTLEYLSSATLESSRLSPSVSSDISRRYHRPVARCKRPIRTYMTPSLRLQLTVACKAQPGSRQFSTTTVHEDLTVFWSSVKDSLETERGFWDEFSLYTLIPQDLRLNTDLKWSLLNSWITRASRAVSENILDGHPSRLLDLTREEQIKLVEGLQEPYAALSHRWGASRHLTATAQTLEGLKSGISIELLPRTFRDAVFTTRRLGADFLWIDALCIVQDDEADWRRESMTMGDVFMNAKFVIAVHCAADDSEGFLTEALSTRNVIELELPDTGHLNGTIGLCRRNNFEADVTKSALSKRGWVLQERFLATHTLHFTRHGIFSETGSEVFSEDGRLESRRQKGMRIAFLGPSALPGLRYLLTNADICRTAESGSKEIPGQTPLDWLTLTEMYTTCDLTKEEDKLFAIAGVARKIQSRQDSVWCAGLWSDRISQGLSWFPGQRLSAPTNPRAPSWSWAAWDGSIQYPEILQDASYQARVKFVSVHEVAPTSASTVTTWLDSPGLLRIRANILPLDNVIFTQDCAQLGPGPERRGYLTSDQRDLPRIAFKQYFLAYTLRGRRYTTRHRDNMKGPRLVVRADRLPPCGWLAFDDPNTSWTQKLSFDDEPNISLQGCCFALLGAYRASNGGLVYLGIFLQLIDGCDSENPEYFRIGCGQLSHSFMSGEYLDPDSQGREGLAWSTNSDASYPLVPTDLARMSTVQIR